MIKGAGAFAAECHLGKPYNFRALPFLLQLLIKTYKIGSNISPNPLLIILFIFLRFSLNSSFITRSSKIPYLIFLLSRCLSLDFLFRNNNNSLISLCVPLLEMTTTTASRDVLC
ncbi:hypothetical protein Csa_013315 [Cucumis sativus]|nr:hypothetical protein Csa_013315 [Cucumis sativus]